MVELLSIYGDDDMVANVARVSYGKESENYSYEQNSKLLKYLWKNNHCYDKDTEVLTSEGFVYWKDINEKHLLANVNPINREFIGFKKPIKLIIKNINEEIILFDSGQINLAVTKGHSLYCSLSNTTKKRYEPIFELIKANDIVTYQNNTKYIYDKPMRMCKCAFNSVKGGNPSLYKLYGFFIGDGHSASVNTISFHLKKERKIKFLKKISLELNLKLDLLKQNIYRILSPNIGKDFSEMFYCDKNKTFPDSFYNMTSDEYEGFKEGLLNSDGHLKRGVIVYDTSSDILANKLQSLGSINGDSIAYNKNKHIKRLNYCTRQNQPRLNDTDKNNVSVIPYKGKVYCATVQSGLLIVRRNNKIVLSGNSSPFRHPQLQFRIKCPIYVERQIFKHQKGISTNSISGRYVDFSDTYTTIDTWRKQSKSSKQGSEGEIDNQELATQIETNIINVCKTAYKELIDLGVSKEQARTILPINLNTEFIWTGSLQAFLHLCKLRLKKDAQYETRMIVQQMLELVQVEPNFKNTLDIVFNEKNK